VKIHRRSVQIGKRRVTHTLQRFLDRDLLRVDEAFDRDGDGQINVIRTDVLAQRHPSARLCHANHALQVAHRDGEGARGSRLAPQVRKEPRELLRVQIVQLWSYLFARIHDIFAEEVLRDQLAL